MNLTQAITKRLYSVSTNPRISITLDVEGATEDDLASGALAAIAVFEEADVDPWEAAEAAFNIEWTPDLNTITAEEGDLHGVYLDAIEAALKVACQDLPNTPKKYCFSLLLDEEEPTLFAPEKEIWYPTTIHGRPPEEIKTPLNGKRRRLVGNNWEWENVNG